MDMIYVLLANTGCVDDSDTEILYVGTNREKAFSTVKHDESDVNNYNIEVWYNGQNVECYIKISEKEWKKTFDKREKIIAEISEKKARIELLTKELNELEQGKRLLPEIA